MVLGAGEAEADLKPTRSLRPAAWLTLKGFGAAMGVCEGMEAARGLFVDGAEAKSDPKSFLSAVDGAAAGAGVAEAETKSAKSSSSSSFAAGAGAGLGAPKSPRMLAEGVDFAGAGGGEEKDGPSSKPSKSSIGAAAFGGGAAAFGGALDTEGLERCWGFGFGGETGRGIPLSANSS